MKNLRVEITDDGIALYLAADPEGLWAKTTKPDNLISIDWDKQGRVIGIEAIGSVASNAIQALLQALADYPAADLDSLRSAFAKLTATNKPKE